MAFNTNLQLVMNYLKQGKHTILPAQAAPTAPYPGLTNPNLNLAQNQVQQIPQLQGTMPGAAPSPIKTGGQP